VLANLRHAAERGAREVVILDPTLNQRRDFPDFLRLLAQGNPERQFTYFAELRAEGITRDTARLLREANFTEVEVGLQSVDRRAQELMDRPVNLPAFERGVRAMQEEGLRVKLDLIIGLPGDTVDSVRRGIEFLRGLRPTGGVQVFNLSVLPGTAFREQASQLGLDYQPRPPYYVLHTPTLSVEQIVLLMEEAQAALAIDFDPLPPPHRELARGESGLSRGCRIDLDRGPSVLPAPGRRCQAFVLWLQSAEFRKRVAAAAELIAQILSDNPHTTLQVTLEPTAGPEQLTAAVLEPLRAACFRSSSYLDRYYSLQPAGLWGAKQLVVLLPSAERGRLGSGWRKTVGEYAAIVWRGNESSQVR
jgi:Radical SAM superfamily